jgi:hypothetical protein
MTEDSLRTTDNAATAKDTDCQTSGSAATLAAEAELTPNAPTEGQRMNQRATRSATTQLGSMAVTASNQRKYRHDTCPRTDVITTVASTIGSSGTIGTPNLRLERGPSSTQAKRKSDKQASSASLKKQKSALPDALAIPVGGNSIK